MRFNNKAKWMEEVLFPTSLEGSMARLKFSRDNTKRMKRNIITTKNISF